MAFDPAAHDFARSAVRLPSGKLARSADEYDALTASASQAEAEADAEAPADAPATSRPGSRSELEAMDKADLEALAADRGLTVTRADGKGGAPLKSDYVSALAGS